MADQKPECVNFCTIEDCTPIDKHSEQWFEFHMPCWICHCDKPEQRSEMMWSVRADTHFHSSCIINRAEVQNNA